MVSRTNSSRFLMQEDLHDFVERLLELGELFAPKSEGEAVTLGSISSPEELVEEFDQPRNGPRSVVEPQNEVLLTYRDSLDPTITERLPSRRRRIVLWCRPCDARALSALDDNFLTESMPDPYYGRRRRSTLLIGLGCDRPFPFCFCGSVGGDPFGTDNLDVLMTRVEEEGYMFEVLTEGGRYLEEQLVELLREPTPQQIRHVDRVQRTAKTLLPRQAPDAGEVVARLEGLFDSEIWKEWGDRCIGCGICTYLCPTCWCFDITDVESRGRGYRIRTYDSCQFPLFTLHSSGHNPRPDKASRVRQRVMHKFRYHPVNHGGRVACVGCGRCTELCPMDIDLIAILDDVIQAGERQ